MHIETAVLKGFSYPTPTLGLFVGPTYKVCRFMFRFLFHYKRSRANDSEMLLLTLYFAMLPNVSGAGECSTTEYRKGMVYLVFPVVISLIWSRVPGLGYPTFWSQRNNVYMYVNWAAWSKFCKAGDLRCSVIRLFTTKQQFPFSSVTPTVRGNNFFRANFY